MSKSGTVIAFANSKGGTGKTTLTIHLGVYLAALGKRVGLVALDVQSDLLHWSAKRFERGHEPMPEVYKGLEGLEEVIANLEAEGLDYLLIDCPPHFLEDVEQALATADLVVIPIKAGPLDLWSRETIMYSVAEMRKPHLVVINESPQNWKITEAARKLLEDSGHRLAATDIKTRTGYRWALADGLTAPEVERDGKAEAELGELWTEIAKALKADQRTARKAKAAT